MSGPLWSPSENPYDAPKGATSKPTDIIGYSGPWKMDYFGGVNMIQSNPKWFGNICMAGLCGLIPIVGPIVLTGYTFETVELLHRSNGKLYWDFNFNRFSEYLTRGLGPFLVALVFAFIQFFVFMLAYFGSIICIVLIAGQQQGPPSDAMGIVMSLIMLFAILAVMAISVFINFLLLPLQLRGGLANEIGESFKFNFALEFARKMWVEMLKVMLVWMLFSIIAGPIIIFTCYIGIIPVMGYMFLLQGWFFYQLYRKYLSKGGQPIPMKPMPAMPQA